MVRPRLAVGIAPSTALVLPAVAFLLVVLVVPILLVLARSVLDPSPTIENYETLLRVPAYTKVLLNTFRIALIVTVICIVLGYVLAYQLAQTRGLAFRLLLVAVVLPLWTTELVRVFSWTILLARQGPINGALVGVGLLEQPTQLLFNEIGVLVGAVHVMLPFFILPLYSVMRGIDPNLVKAGQSLGANPWRAFRYIYLPLSMPGLIAGALLVFVLSTGFFIVPVLLGGPDQQMIASLIENQVRRSLNWGLAAAMAVELLVATGLILVAYGRLVGLSRLGQGLARE
jgi:ABC-type spermidine/putrescine transport system permease subunit I